MSTTNARPVAALAIAIAAVAWLPRAEAALGEAASSIESDGRALTAARRGVAAHPRFTVETLQSDSATVREYVSPAGVVFAVAWDGLAQPDLTPLLGAHAGEYRAALEGTPRIRGRRSQRVVAENVVVETWGHMRHLQGRAYLPALLPGGVTIDDIK